MEKILHRKKIHDESIVDNKSNKHFKTKDLELEHIVQEIENLETEYKSFTSNISNEEQKCLERPNNNPDIILKPTDKGGGLVLMYKSYYQDSLVIKGHLDSNVY